MKMENQKKVKFLIIEFVIVLLQSNVEGNRVQKRYNCWGKVYLSRQAYMQHATRTSFGVYGIAASTNQYSLLFADVLWADVEENSFSIILIPHAPLEYLDFDFTDLSLG